MATHSVTLAAAHGAMSSPADAQGAQVPASAPGGASAARRAWVTRLAVIFAAWTALGAFDLAKDLCRGLAQMGHGPTRVALVMTFESLWLWALFTPGIFALAERVPIERSGAGGDRKLAGALGLHVAFAAGLSVVDVIVDHAFTVAFMPEAYKPLGVRFFGESFINLYSYALVLGVGTALRYHRLSHERQVRVARLETELVEANLEALERQLRPHFLYNTLHTVSALVRTQRGPEAVRVIAMLGDLLRHALRTAKEHEVALEREVDFARQYLAIEEVRFGGSLRVRAEIDDDVRGAMVPHFLLQPIVENAVRHGVEPSGKGGEVLVRAARRGGVLCIDVRDTGCGAMRSEGRGIGLGATRARLAQMYGGDQRLDLTVDPREGTIVRVVIPFRLAPAAVPS